MRFAEVFSAPLFCRTLRIDYSPKPTAAARLPEVQMPHGGNR